MLLKGRLGCSQIHCEAHEYRTRSLWRIEGKLLKHLSAENFSTNLYHR